MLYSHVIIFVLNSQIPFKNSLKWENICYVYPHIYHFCNGSHCSSFLCAVPIFIWCHLPSSWQKDFKGCCKRQGATQSACGCSSKETQSQAQHLVSLYGRGGGPCWSRQLQRLFTHLGAGNLGQILGWGPGRKPPSGSPVSLLLGLLVLVWDWAQISIIF